MKKILIYSLIACTFAACKKNGETPEVVPAEPIPLTARQTERARLDNQFAFKMFQIVADTTRNTFFSPLSLNLAMGMLYNGTSGEARSEMASVMGFADFTDEEINEYYRMMSEALLKADRLTELGIANSIWYRDIYPVKQTFFDINKQYFSAEVRGLDFSDPRAADIINSWCAEKTNDRIKNIIEPPIPTDVVMYLINALYFKSKWQFNFDKAQSKPANFTMDDGTTAKTTLMEQTADLPYFRNDSIQCVEMPYGNQAFSMVLVMPTNNMPMNELVNYLDNGRWNAIADKFAVRNIHLKMPRFKLECELPLKKSVAKAGITQIYEAGHLLNIADDGRLFVSNIKQKTFVEVNEEGTEAAAVTVVEVGYTSAPSQPLSFIADHPFIYLIKERSTGVILFIGRMDEPKE